MTIFLIFFTVTLVFSLIILWMILDYQFIRLKSELRQVSQLKVKGKDSVCGSIHFL